jgi:uncharacterized protein (TIGR02466 family)
VWSEILDYTLSQEQLDFALNLERCRNMGNSRSVESDVLGKEIFSPLKELFLESINGFIDQIYCPSQPPSPYITQSWVNFTEVNQYHHAHNHTNSFISGVYYLKADLQYDQISFSKTDNNVFHIKPRHFGMFNSTDWSLRVQTNQLVLFPSTLTHLVQPTVNPDLRVSLSFNTFLKGEMGSPEYLNYLCLS